MALTPNYIFENGFRGLEPYFLEHPHTLVSFRRGEYLWRPGEPYHRLFYIREGVAATVMDHESGKRRILSFHAAGTVYPMFHYRQYKLEDTITCTAVTHVKALSFSQDDFARMFEENETLRHAVIDWFSSATNLLLYEIGHQEQNDSFMKLCNLLYLLQGSGNKTLGSLTQENLSEILGISLNNVTRSLTKLREAGIIETGRKAIRVTAPKKLQALCSGETL